MKSYNGAAFEKREVELSKMRTSKKFDTKFFFRNNLKPEDFGN